MASALEDLLSDFTDNAGSMPRVNPPEAAKVLSEQTAPEVAGEPEPAPVDEAPPAPTEKPAEVKAAEAASKRKPRGANAKAEPSATTSAPASAPAAPSADAIEQLRLLAFSVPRGVTITIVIEGQ
jgi:hypothetical protein